MANPAAPHVPQEPERPERSKNDFDADAPNALGPDAPNVRDDDPRPSIPVAEPPTPPSEPLEEDDFAPDEG